MTQTFASRRYSMLCVCAIGLRKSAADSITAVAKARRDTVVLLRVRNARRVDSVGASACQCNRLRTFCLRACQPGEGRAGDPHDAPGLQHDGAAATIEINGGRIPVEDVPLHAGTAALNRDSGNTREQRLADPAA